MTNNYQLLFHDITSEIIKQIRQIWFFFRNLIPRSTFKSQIFFLHHIFLSINILFQTFFWSPTIKFTITILFAFILFPISTTSSMPWISMFLNCSIIYHTKITKIFSTLVTLHMITTTWFITRLIAIRTISNIYFQIVNHIANITLSANMILLLNLSANFA